MPQRTDDTNQGYFCRDVEGKKRHWCSSSGKLQSPLQLAFRIFYEVLSRKKKLENLIAQKMKSLAVLLQVFHVESAEGPAQAGIAARILA